ncbi:hypothetical protein R6L23_00975 [Streptomyces sp. SR27]|uniref:hypothetical protein n=1 Tax=Streptomyces sp. SR27 TaxID=3076630 RepID=UPI00295B9A3A|nr:hypothetical protein [Streptomyces sp. SR27]MDV9186821.1 hypothetical protein [Streptomyces sp. SR27]
MAIDGTPGNQAGHQPAHSSPQDGSGKILAWCEFGFKVLCVGAGVTLYFKGAPVLGLALLAAAGIQIVINRR